MPKKTDFNIKGLTQLQRDLGIWWISMAILWVGMYESNYLWMNKLYPYPVCSQKISLKNQIYCGEAKQNLSSCLAKNSYYNGNKFLCPFSLYTDYSFCYGKLTLSVSQGNTGMTYTTPNNHQVSVTDPISGTSASKESFCGEMTNRFSSCFMYTGNLKTNFLFYCPFWNYKNTFGETSKRNCSSPIEFRGDTDAPFCKEGENFNASTCIVHPSEPTKFLCPYDSNYYGNNYCNKTKDGTCYEKFFRSPYCSGSNDSFSCLYNSTYSGGSEIDVTSQRNSYLANGIVCVFFYIALGTLCILIEKVSYSFLTTSIFMMFLSLGYILYMIIYFFWIGDNGIGSFNCIQLAVQIIQIIFAIALSKMLSDSENSDKNYQGNPSTIKTVLSSQLKEMNPPISIENHGNAYLGYGQNAQNLNPNQIQLNLSPIKILDDHNLRPSEALFGSSTSIPTSHIIKESIGEKK